MIHNEPDTTVRHIQMFLGRHTAGEARAHYEAFIAPYFTADGQADLAVGATAITAVAAELGVPATVTAAEFYRTAATTPWHCNRMAGSPSVRQVRAVRAGAGLATRAARAALSQVLMPARAPSP